MTIEGAICLISLLTLILVSIYIYLSISVRKRDREFVQKIRKNIEELSRK